MKGLGMEHGDSASIDSGCDGAMSVSRRAFIKVAATVSVAVMGASFVGCGSSESQGSSGTQSAAGSKPKSLDDIDVSAACDVAIVCARRANSGIALAKGGEWAVPDVEKDLMQTVAAEGFLALVRADGNPQSASTMVTLENTNETRRLNEISDDVSSILATDLSAQAPEVDLLAAISSANKALGQASGERPRKLIVLDSGVSTKGAVNFTESASIAALYDSEQFVQSLQKQGKLTLFDHIDEVEWYGMGNVVDPQPHIEDTTVKAMKYLWQAVFAQAGADVPFESFVDISDSVNPPDGLPSVTPVNMPLVPINEETDRPCGPGDQISYNDASGSELRFELNSAEFTNPDAASTELQKYIDELKALPSLHVTVEGYTDSTGSDETNQQLSQERAQAVADLIVAGGVSADQVTAEGKGVSTAYDTDEQNRHVELVFS